MKGRDLWRLSLRNVFSVPLRTALTILGMSIGIAAVLAVLSLGDAGKRQVRSEMRRLGIDKVWITSEEASVLSEGDGELLAQSFEVQSAEAVCLPAQISSRFATVQTALIGCTQSYMNMSGIAVLKGSMLHPSEWMAESSGVLLGYRLAEQLVVRPGETVWLADVPLIVRGVVDASESFARIDTATAAIVPIKTATAWNGKEIHEIVLQVPLGTAPDEMAERAQKLLESRGKQPVDTLTLQVQMEAADSVLATFVNVLGWVAAVCILVGGIGVMNVLLISVRERKREIGIMKSLGTTQRQICVLFLLEAVVYAACGGVTGIVIGQLLIAIAGRSIGLEAYAKMSECLIVFSSAVMIGLFFGVLPASRAAALECVDALRDG